MYGYPIQYIMTVMLDKTEDIPEQLLTTMLAHIGEGKYGASLASHGIVRNVMEQCANKLEPYMNHLITSTISTKEVTRGYQMSDQA